MLVMAAEGLVTPAARDAFAAAVAGDASNVPARFYLALAEAQEGRPREALAVWAKLAEEAPPDAPWLEALRQRMAETARAAGLEIPPEARGAGGVAEKGPGAADVAAAEAMSPEERAAMVRGMVDALAARLAHNPNDAAALHRLPPA